tara:strand:- start:358 stop:1014 length:657 start_codon:yes stop_codon:yes gene_type:complete
MLDFATANMFDLDKRGGLDLFGFEKKRKKKAEEERRSRFENNPKVEKFRERKEELDLRGDMPSDPKLNTYFDMKSNKAYIDGQEVDLKTFSEFKKLPYAEQLKQKLDFFNETSSIGGESSNFSQKIDFLPDEISKLVPTDNEMIQTNNLQSVQSPNLGNKGVLAQQDLANVAEVEIKSTTSDIAFVNLQRLQSSKFNNITHVNESELPSSIRKLLKIS